MTHDYLLLTATIKPRVGQGQLSIVDPAVRLMQYRRALAFYVDALRRGVVRGVVLFDNSDADISELARGLAHPRLEVLQRFMLDYPAEYHRGYGELTLIDEAYNQSALLQAAAPADRIWKVTGRYIVRNLPRVLHKTPAGFDLYCDIRHHRTWAEMSVMAWNQRGYTQAVQGAAQHCRTGKVPELILCERFLALADSGLVRLCGHLPWPPFLEGNRGHDGSRYGGRWPFARHVLDVAAAQRETWAACLSRKLQRQ